MSGILTPSTPDTTASGSSEFVPENEQEILSNLIQIRDDLSHLKKDRSKFLQSSDVNALYQRVVTQLRQLNQIRSTPQLSTEQNRVDTVLSDVFQLLSLSFLTVGLNRKLPATFASLNAVKRLLDQMSEGLQSFTSTDVAHIRQRLEDISNILEEETSKGEGQEAPEIVSLLKKKMALCQEKLEAVEKNLQVLDPLVEKYYEKLIFCKREIMSIATGDHVTVEQFTPLVKQVQEIAEKLQEIERSNPEVNLTPAISLVDVCLTLVKDFSSEGENINMIDANLHPLFKELVSIKRDLENLMVTRRWTLRETDLYTYQSKLQKCEKEAKAFKEQAHNEPLKGYLFIIYMMRRCYAIIYKLLESSEPVSEALTPLHNQLTTVRRCLLDVQRVGGISKLRELYPYQMKLASIDNMRVDGKFMVGDSIPEGQGMINALLAECFDICNELKEQCEE